MKKPIVMFMCAVLALSMAACGAEKKETAEPSQETAAAEETAGTSQETLAEEETAGAMLGGQMQIANPFTDCETMEEAAKITGFSLKLPEDLPDGIEETAVRVMDGTMIEVILTGSGEELRFRKAAGSEDISGDYETYELME